MAARNMKMLSLDGGGVRGLSSLMILESIMRKLSPEDPPKPCDVFDIICGTSTGGLIAIMLGRLKMDVSACLEAYLKISDKVFAKKAHRLDWKGRVQARFSSAELKDAVSEVITGEGYEPDMALLEKQEPKCKVFVCVTRSHVVGTTLLSSYHSRRYPPDPTIRVWEAALATCAASSFFDPISIGRLKIQYVDGATGANNPVRQIWREAMDIWGSRDLDDRVNCLVSIGTGVPGARRFGDSVLEVARTLKEIATDTQNTANEFYSEHSGMSTGRRYFRFNVQRGLEDIGLEQSDGMPEVAAATSAYLEEEPVLLAAESCARRLSMHSTSQSRKVVFLPGQETWPSQTADKNLVLLTNDRQRPIDRMLQIAVARNDLRETERLLSDGRSETPTLRSQQEALYEASKLGYAPLVEYLLKDDRRTKLNVNAPTAKQQFSSLQAAAASGHELVVKMLLDAGADPNLVGGKYGTALQAAAFYGRNNVIRLLLSQKADVNQCGGQDSYPLQAAVGQGRQSTTALLLGNGANVLLLPEGLRIRANSLTEEAGDGVR